MGQLGLQWLEITGVEKMCPFTNIWGGCISVPRCSQDVLTNIVGAGGGVYHAVLKILRV